MIPGPFLLYLGDSRDPADTRSSKYRYDGGWDVIEGRCAWSHPSFSGVSTRLLHGAQPEAIVLCHDTVRAHMRGLPGRALPGLGETLEMNLSVARPSSPALRAVGICLKRRGQDEAQQACARSADEVGLPCTDPVRSGVAAILDELTGSPSSPRVVRRP